VNTQTSTLSSDQASVWHQSTKPLSTRWVWLGFAVLVLVFGRIYINFVQDDAYITYRYAHNLASGMGMLYNPGEWVLGTSTPFYTFMLAGFHALTGLSIETISKCINILCLWACAGLLFEISKPNHSLVGISIGLLFITNPILPHSIGMESLFLLLLILVTIRFYTKDKFLLATIASGFLMITRYEMVLVAIVLASHYFIVQRKMPFWLLPAFFIFAIWLLSAFFVYGSPIPQSMYAKLTTSHVPFLLGAAFYWTTFGHSFQPIYSFLFFLILGFISLFYMKKPSLNHRLVLTISAFYLIIASLIAGSFPWYYVPLVPAFVILVVYGIDFISNPPGLDQTTDRFSPAFEHIPKLLFISTSAFLIACQLVLWAKDFKAYTGDNLDYRYVPYLEIADWLNHHAEEGQTLAASEIGYLGYFTNLHIIDLHGLVTPGLNYWLEQGTVETLRQVLLIYAPDYVVIKSNQSQIELMNADSRYKLMQIFYNDYLLYRK
jgi:hypothetical protein